MLPKIYHYRPATGEYLEEGVADPDPLVDDHWLIPAYATEIKPPVAGEHEVAVYEDGEWQLKPDYRGQVFYDAASGGEIVITEIGLTPEPSWTTELPPPQPETPEQTIERLKAEIRAIEFNDLMNRRAREAFIVQAETIAAEQFGMTPEQLYLANPGYKGAKDIDNQIAQLRAQISALEDQL